MYGHPFDPAIPLLEKQEPSSMQGRAHEWSLQLCLKWPQTGNRTPVHQGVGGDMPLGTRLVKDDATVWMALEAVSDMRQDWACTMQFHLYLPENADSS